jgi:ABC-type oligopeptide transport system substrate-binding subunit
MPLASPQRKEILDQGKWEFSQPVTGKYRITKYKHEMEIALEPNPFNSIPGQSKILYKVIPEENTALNLLETVNIDIITSIPTTEINRLQKQGLIKTFAGAATYFLSFNANKEPFKQALWRKAVSGAIDRKQLAGLMNGIMIPSQSYLPSSIEGAKSLVLDFTDEKKSVKAAKKPEKIVLAYAATNTGNMLMQKVQNDLQTKLDISITLEPLEWKAFLNRLRADAADIFFLGFGAPFNDPLSHLKVFVAGESNNHSKFSDSKYTDLVEQIKVTSSGPERVRLIETAQKIVVKDLAIVVPLTERVELVGVAKSVKDFSQSPYGVKQLHLLRK